MNSTFWIKPSGSAPFFKAGFCYRAAACLNACAMCVYKKNEEVKHLELLVS